MLRWSVPRDVNIMFSGFSGPARQTYVLFKSGLDSRSDVGLNLRVKVTVEAASPSFEAPPTTAATLMLYWDPDVRFLITKEVSMVVFSPPAQRTMYHVTFPSGCAQLRDTDEVVTSVMIRFPTAAGSANGRDNRVAQEVATEASMGTWKLSKF